MASLFINCDYSFRRKIMVIAAKAGESAEAVFAKWSEYCRQCSLFDQSPVLSEFCNWNKYEQPPQD